ncbi:MAG: serine/threonine protein kinase [Myxococcales bacterium]|nr:serine/threonine protein kinase [Myxococcales bacterium]
MTRPGFAVSSDGGASPNAQIIDDKYRIVRVLGEGGMGAVYEAVHLVTGRRVALKVIVSELLAREEGIVTRFQREARASGAIDSQYVVQVLDSGIDAATKNPYLVMEYLSGEDLGQLIHRLGVLPPDLALRITAQACLGLQRAHDAGIIHRDIKSANTYLARRDNGEIIVKLLDFGIAKVRADPFAEGGDHKLTRTGSMIGSPLYMSPEQARGSKALDARADIWSLGVALYEALAGTTPNHHCDTIGNLIVSLCSDDAEPLQNRAPWVSSEIAAVVHKALARAPDHRFTTATEMYDAIVALTGRDITIREDMLVALSDAEKASVAPRAGTSTDSQGPRIVLKSGAPVSDMAQTALAVAATTGPGLGDSSVTPPPKKKAAFVLPAIAAVAVVGIVAGGMALKGKADAKVTAAPEAPKAAPSEVAPAPPPSVVEKVTEKVVVLVKSTLTVTPPGAEVLVDGELVASKGGVVELKGPVGSHRKVDVKAEGKTVSADVVLSEAGAVPSKVDVPVAAPVRAAAGKPSTPAAGNVANAPAAPKPAAPAPAPGGGEPTINRNF